MPGAEEGLRAAQSLLVQQASVLEQIAADCDAVKRLADDQLVGVTPPPGEAAVEGMAGSLQRGSSAKLLEKCGELEGTHDRHLQALLPSLRSLDVELRGVQDGELAAQGALSVRLFHRLRCISQLQSQIAELRNKLHLYASLLERVHMYCSQLLLMRRLPATYHACLAEVARRRQFGQLYARRGHDAAESLASLREEEVGQRDDFMREHGALLPRGMPQLSLLLGERPPYFEIGTNSSESQLISLSHALSLEAGHGDGRGEGFAAAEPVPADAAVPPLTSVDLLADDAAVAMAVAVAPAAARSAAPAAAAAEPHSSCGLAPASEPAVATPPAASVVAEPAAEPAAAEAAPSAAVAAVAAGSEAAAGAAAEAPLAAPPAAAARGFGALASGSALGMPPITRSVSEHSSLHKFGFSGLLQGLRGEESSLRPRFAPLASADCLALTQEAVLAGQCSGELSEVGAALEALGTPLEGLSVEVASQLQRRLAQQERAAVVLRAEARAHTAALERAEAALAAERQRADALQRQLESAAEAGGGASGGAPGGAPEVRLLIRVQGHETPPGTPPRTASDALPEGTGAGAGADTAGAAPPEEAKAAAAAAAAAAAEATAAAAEATAAAAVAAAAAEAASLREEVRGLEAKHAALLLQQHTLAEEHQLLSSGVHTAMSCLPPPGPIRAGGEGGASGAGSSGEGESAGGGEEEGAEEADGSVRTAQLRADDLCSSARQAAHANARLGHAMASEREAHKATQTRAQRRLAYLASDLGSQPPTRLLFTAQAPSHAPPGGVAFAGLLLPVLRSGLPTHWLSSESIASLRRWCDDEGVPLSKLRAVVGKAVHVSGPQLAGSEGNGQPINPYNLPAGETYHIVHAEMQLQHHWVAD
jgi:hypothetical protein